METIKAIIFDCFGVLYPQAAGEFFEKNKSEFSGNENALDELNRQIDLGEITRTEFFAGLEKASGIPAKAIRSEIDSQLKADKRLLELIKELRKKYRIGLLSNAGEEEIVIIYRDEIDSLFDAVAVSHEVGVSKPEPEIFLICAQRLGVDSHECLFVDDSAINLEAAKKLGMETLDYPKFGKIPSRLTQLK